MELQPPIPATIRSYRIEDQAACRTLYIEGLIAGSIADNDTGADMDDITGAYMRSAGSHFWVAENAMGEVVGMIGVQGYDGAGEIRRLRVRTDSRRRRIGSALVETAVQFCQDHGYLKVTLDTYMEREPALNLFAKFHFKQERSRIMGVKELRYFYLDLYTRDQPSRAGVTPKLEHHA